MLAKLGDENLLRMVRWHYPPDTEFEHWRAEADHATCHGCSPRYWIFYEWAEKKHFVSLFFHRFVSEWNSLPIQIRDSTSVNSFKHQLMLHYKLKLQQSFNVNDLCSWTSTCRCQPCVCNRMKNLFLSVFIAIFKYLLTILIF